MPTIYIRGMVIGYTDTGAPDGMPDAPVVVFGHGLLFGGWMFRPQIEALRDQYRCVTIDWRGQGETPATPGGYDMDTLTADAVGLIAALGVAPVHWVGLSMGGFVGQRVAARHGELLRSLTLLDTSAGAEDPVKARERGRLAWFQLLFGIKPVLGKVKPLLFGSAFLADRANEDVLAEWLRRLRRSPRSAIRKAVLGVAGRSAVDAEIGGITAPTLVVVGADDRATPPAHAERIAALIPGARLRVVADCGHSCTLEQPTAISGLLAEFLGAVDQAAVKSLGAGLLGVRDADVAEGDEGDRAQGLRLRRAGDRVDVCGGDRDEISWLYDPAARDDFLAFPRGQDLDRVIDRHIRPAGRQQRARRCAGREISERAEHARLDEPVVLSEFFTIRLDDLGLPRHDTAECEAEVPRGRHGVDRVPHGPLEVGVHGLPPGHAGTLSPRAGGQAWNPAVR